MTLVQIAPPAQAHRQGRLRTGIEGEKTEASPDDLGPDDRGPDDFYFADDDLELERVGVPGAGSSGSRIYRGPDSSSTRSRVQDLPS